MGNTAIQKRIITNRMAISNASRDAEILELLDGFSFDLQRLGLGRDLVDAADRLFQAQMDAYKNHHIAGEEARDIRRGLREQYTRTRGLARIALGKDEALGSVLNLDGRSRRDLASWLEEARLFYTNALDHPPVLEKLAGLGINAETLEGEQAGLDEVEKAAAFHQRQKGVAMQATTDRDRAVAAMDAWMGDFWKVCRIAFAGKPLLIKKLKEEGGGKKNEGRKAGR